ncbi:MAG: hypothetical protein Q7J42_08105 [Sulfuritalea sp.]|nr:hypothetical protein [Sulfuritalea sp.]
MTVRPELFLLLSNARSGSTYVATTLSSVGARCNFEYSLKSYSPVPVNGNLHLLSGITDIYISIYVLTTTELEPGVILPFGAKLTLPIYDYLPETSVRLIEYACHSVSLKRIHLVRDYWDLLKSNLSRGVAHDYDSKAPGIDLARTAKEAATLRERIKDDYLDHGREKPMAQVDLPIEIIKGYLVNLLRNDYVFRKVTESGQGVTIAYSDIKNEIPRVLDFLGANYDRQRLRDVLEVPMVRKLPDIPDSKIAHPDVIKPIATKCYEIMRDGVFNNESAELIFSRQMAVVGEYSPQIVPDPT